MDQEVIYRHKEYSLLAVTKELECCPVCEQHIWKMHSKADGLMPHDYYVCFHCDCFARSKTPFSMCEENWLNVVLYAKRYALGLVPHVEIQFAP